MVGLGIFLSLLAIEIGMRMFYFVSDRQIFGLTPKRSTLGYYNNDFFGSALKPNQGGWFVTQTHEYFNKVKTNSEGWPDTEHVKEKPTGVYRILFLGDSFVENFQVPFEKRFAQQLQKKLGTKVETITLGRGNTGTAQQYLILKNYGLNYHPDLVVHMFLTANDIKNNSYELQKDSKLPYFKLDDEQHLLLVKQQIGSGFLYKTKEIIKKLRTVEFILSIRQKIQEARSVKDYGFPNDYGIYLKQETREYTSAWQVTKKLILASKEAAEANSAKYILVPLSNNEQINNDVWEKLLITYPAMKDQDMDLNKPDIILKDFCFKEKIDCQFMTPFFRNYTKENPDIRTHFFYDGHWNEVGTNLAAKFLYDKVLTPLLQKKIIPQD